MRDRMGGVIRGISGIDDYFLTGRIPPVIRKRDRPERCNRYEICGLSDSDGGFGLVCACGQECGEKTWRVQLRRRYIRHLYVMPWQNRVQFALYLHVMR